MGTSRDGDGGRGGSELSNVGERLRAHVVYIKNIKRRGRLVTWGGSEGEKKVTR